MKISLILIGLLVTGSVLFWGRLKYMDLEEGYRLNYETGHYCKSFENLSALSKLNKDYVERIASFYSRGLCTRFDISRALELYQTAYKGDKNKISESLYFDAAENIRLGSEFKNTNPENVRQVLKISKELGFKPSPSQIIELKEFKDIFE